MFSDDSKVSIMMISLFRYEKFMCEIIIPPMIIKIEWYKKPKAFSVYSLLIKSPIPINC